MTYYQTSPIAFNWFIYAPISDYKIVSSNLTPYIVLKKHYSIHLVNISIYTKQIECI